MCARGQIILYPFIQPKVLTLLQALSWHWGDTKITELHRSSQKPTRDHLLKEISELDLKWEPWVLSWRKGKLQAIRRQSQEA